MSQSLHLLCMLWADEATVTHDASGYSLILKNVDRKILYSTSRPKKVRGFIEAEKVMSIWTKNNEAFVQEPPEIALAYTKMTANQNGIANAIPIDLFNPVKLDAHTWIFKLSFRETSMAMGTYANITLFIDWFPTLYCPKPIEALLPNFFNL